MFRSSCGARFCRVFKCAADCFVGDGFHHVQLEQLIGHQTEAPTRLSAWRLAAGDDDQSGNCVPESRSASPPQTGAGRGEGCHMDVTGAGNS